MGPAAVAAADEALAVWGGSPFPGLSIPRLDLARGPAESRHRLVAETRVRGLLEANRPMEAVDALGPPVTAEPDVQVWHALRVRALHQAGRPREATEAFLAARRHLREEPGDELGEAYRRLLTDRARTPVPTSAGPEAATRRPRRTPRQDRREPGRRRGGRADRHRRGRGENREVLAARRRTPRRGQARHHEDGDLGREPDPASRTWCTCAPFWRFGRRGAASARTRGHGGARLVAASRGCFGLRRLAN